MSSNLLNFGWHKAKPTQQEADDDFGEFASAAEPSSSKCPPLNSSMLDHELPVVNYAGVQPTTPVPNGFFTTKKHLTSSFNKPVTLSGHRMTPLIAPQSFPVSPVSSQTAVDSSDDFGDFCTSPAFPVAPVPTSTPNNNSTSFPAVFPPPPNSRISEPKLQIQNSTNVHQQPNYCISLDEEELFTPTITWAKPRGELGNASTLQKSPIEPVPLNPVETLEDDEFGDFAAAQANFTSPLSSTAISSQNPISSMPNYNQIGPMDALKRLRKNAPPSIHFSSIGDLNQTDFQSSTSELENGSVKNNDIAFLDDEQGLTMGYFNPLDEETPGSESWEANTPHRIEGESFGNFLQSPAPTESSNAFKPLDEKLGAFIQPSFGSAPLLLPSDAKIDLKMELVKREELNESIEEAVGIVSIDENHSNSPQSESRLSPEGLSGGEEEEFGDFATQLDLPLPELEIPIVKPVLSSLEREEDDDFGDFADFESAPMEINHVEPITQPSMAKELLSDGSDDGFDDFAAAPSSLPFNLKLQSSSVETQLQTLVETMFPLPRSSGAGSDRSLAPVTSLEVLCQGSEGAIWAYVRDPNSTPALSFQWSKSKLRNTWFKAIGIDEHGTNFGGLSGVPRFAVNLNTPLQPVKLGSLVTPMNDTSLTSTLDGSGLCNTLDLDFFVNRSPADEGDSAPVLENGLDVVFAKPTSESPLSVPKFKSNAEMSAGLVSPSSLLDDFLVSSLSLSESHAVNSVGSSDLLA